MADENESGSGTPYRVAYDLTKTIMYQRRGSDDYQDKDDILRLYLECRRAVLSGKAELVGIEDQRSVSGFARTPADLASHLFALAPD